VLRTVAIIPTEQASDDRSFLMTGAADEKDLMPVAVQEFGTSSSNRQNTESEVGYG